MSKLKIPQPKQPQDSIRNLQEFNRAVAELIIELTDDMELIESKVKHPVIRTLNEKLAKVWQFYNAPE